MSGPSRWKGAALADLRAAYESGSTKVDVLAAEHGTSRGQIMRMAKLHGWVRRGAPRLPAAAHRHWNLYRNVQRIAGRDVALQAVGA